jgi:alanine racemase
MVMVKAFAYGSGSVEIANILQYHRVDYLGVAYPDEGVELRRNNIQLPVMVMNPAEESFEIMLEHKLEPEVYSPGILRALISFLKGRACKVHLKLDTGMHRLGFDPWDISALISLLVANRHIQIASIFSHLAGSDDSMHDAFSAQQFKTFVETAAMIEAAVGYHPLLHMLNSSGILRLPDMQLDMVRLGIGLYGVDPTAENQYGLKPVATLKTIISQVKTIQKGESIGYGRAGIALRDSQIAIIAIGYADGYSRGFSGGIGEVLIRGHRAPVIGNVCMDMTMIDVTGLDTHEGDEVIIFGSGFPIQEIARKLNTIPYEILTSTSERVKRVFLSDGV